MWGDILQLVGLLALLHWGGKTVVAVLDRHQAQAARAAGLARLNDERPASEPWPIREPEVERLRARGAL